MKIAIAQRLQPFSHTPGAFCPIPGSFFSVQVFPTLIRVFDLRFSQPKMAQEIPIPIQGPVKDFTVLCDLERAGVVVWGHAKSGFFRFKIVPTENQIVCIQDRGEPLFPNASLKTEPLIDCGRLSLGSHKALDWDLVTRQSKPLEEIFPVWHLLGQMTPQMPMEVYEGTAQLLISCRESIDSHTPEKIYPAFVNLLKAGFHGLMTPRINDDQLQGIVPANLITNERLSPLLLLSEGAKLIRSLFITQVENQISLLPALPPEFHCGRFINVSLGELGVVHFEWSKKIIRRFIFSSKINGEVLFRFRQVKNFRLRCDKNDNGRRLSSGDILSVKDGVSYMIDNFE